MCYIIKYCQHLNLIFSVLLKHLQKHMQIHTKLKAQIIRKEKEKKLLWKKGDPNQPSYPPDLGHQFIHKKSSWGSLWGSKPLQLIPLLRELGQSTTVSLQCPTTTETKHKKRGIKLLTIISLLWAQLIVLFFRNNGLFD